MILSQLCKENQKPSSDNGTKRAYTFRNESYLQEHYQKHGIKMGLSVLTDSK